MKAFRYIFAFFCILNTAACRKTVTDNSEDIILSRPKYIEFAVSDGSKASNLVESLDSRSFGIIGYSYSSATNWNAFKGGIDCKPISAFYKTTVSSDASGVCSYDPIQQWETGKRYAFFGYYPITSVITGDANTVGVPSLTYTIDWTNPYIDVMRAANSDVDNSGNGTVPLHFYHCLFSFDAAVRNFTEADITISDISVNFTSSFYTSAIIPLDGSPITPSGSRTNQTFSICGSTSVTIPQGGALTRVSAEDKNVLLIPQSGELTGSISVKKDGSTLTVPFDITQEFLPGVRYTLQAAFTDESTLSLEIIETTFWTDVSQDITFE